MCEIYKSFYKENKQKTLYSEDFITQCYKIIIENSDKTLKAISEEFDIKYDLVKRLNSGSSHKRNCFLYPIKDNKEYNKNQINL